MREGGAGDPGLLGRLAAGPLGDPELDEPQRLEMGMRQDLHADLIRRVLEETTPIVGNVLTFEAPIEFVFEGISSATCTISPPLRRARLRPNRS